ncbi:SGNH/GDSL hydrolase family protein [Komagataeibacter sp. FXV2]|nr:SGNH/GDSL hydrolase family protein [Komagataeibacter sp. FXV2]
MTDTTGTDAAGADVLPRLTRLLREGKGVRIALFGSSTIEGVGASTPAHALPAIMHAVLAPFAPGGVEVIGHGVGGDDAEAMHARVGGMLADRPDLIVWQTGSNDPLKGDDVGAFIARTRDDLAQMRASGADVVLMDQQYCPALETCPAFPAFREAVHHIAQQDHVPLFTRYVRMKSWCAELGLEPVALSPDGLHLNDRGYRLLGEALAAWLIELTGLPGGVASCYQGDGA